MSPPSISCSSLGLIFAGITLVLAGAAAWILLGGAVVGSASGATDFTAIPAEVEFAAPAITLQDVRGSEHSLAEYLGRVVLVNIWATWCPPCKAEMPGFQRFYESRRLDGFTIIAINDGESAGEVASFVNEYGLTFPVWLDPTYEASERAFKASNLPTSYVIDRGGTIRLMWIGAISESKLRQYVDPLIKE